MGWALILSAAALLGQPAEDYRWPLDLPRELSSSFAEYRPGRFHAGIDLRTAGSGRPVFAVRDGFVSRVRCSPYGYGKAVYLELDDGNTAVFGHLSDYMPALAAYVRSNQHAKQSYTVDLYPEAGRFAVKKGDLIAYSGQTGIGAPHLHYELRDASQRPINPRPEGITWPDATRPIVRSVLIAPHDGAGLVDDDVFPEVLAVENLGSGNYRTRAVDVQGEVGLGVTVSDPGPGGHSLGIYRMRLLVDGVEQFRVQHDNLSYDNHRNGVVAYQPYFSDEGKFLVAWRWPGNVCSSYAHSAGAGWVGVPAGASEATAVLELTDYHENTSRVEIPLRADTTTIPVPAGAANTQAGSVSLDCVGNALILSAQFPAAEAETPVFSAVGPGGDGPLPVRRVGQRTFRCVWQPAATGTYTLTATHPRLSSWSEQVQAFKRGTAGAGTLDDVEIRASSDSPYGYLFARVYQSPESRATSMTQLGKVYRVWPTESPVDAPVTLSFPMPGGVEQLSRVHMYRLRGWGWSREDTTRSGNRLEISTRTFGSYAAFEDKTAPVLSNVLPAEGYAAQTKRPYVKAKVSDNGSGVEDIRVTCGGQWLLVAYDPEHSEIEWVRDEDLPSGPQVVTFRITDAAGNVKELKRNVVVP
jgi:hypothetical protein